MKRDEQEDGVHSPGPLSEHSHAEDITNQPVSEEEDSLDDDTFIIPDTQVEQECLQQRLIATARSLNKQKQRLKAAQDMLDDKWNEVLDTKGKYGGNRQTKSYLKRKLLPEFDDEAIAPIPLNNHTDDQQDRPPHGRERATNNAAHKSAPPLLK